MCISTISRGGLFGYTTKTLAELQNGNSNSTFTLNEFEGSLFAASIQLSGIIFAPIGIKPT